MIVNHINEVTTRAGLFIAVSADHPALGDSGHD